jgi:tellurite resistance protein TerC
MTIWVWIGFIVFVLAMLALDLGVINRRSEIISTTKALIWTGFCILLALVFNGLVYFLYTHHWLGIGLEVGHKLGGHEAALQFFTGYLIELSLSLDNIFVIAVIFQYFAVPAKYQHRTLFWGILGALILRGAMILAGTALIHRFDWIIYVFGGLLILTALKMLFSGGEEVRPDRNPLVKLARYLYPVTQDFEEERFFTRQNGQRAITPLFLVLLVIESTDVLFAVDSIPAIFAITTDPFLVFTSNVFAILCLRSIFFALAGLLRKFRYLKVSLVFVLAFVGIKMLLTHHYPIETHWSLAVVAGMLAAGVVASMLVARRTKNPPITPAGDLLDLAEQAWKKAKRLVIFVIGSSVVLVGVAMIFLPGPAFLVIPAGLAILATEFLWARRLLQRMKNAARQAASEVMKRG